MSDIDQLMGELNRLDDQISLCIKEFEERLSGKVSISVEIKFQDGTLSWMKINGQWHLGYIENGMATALTSASRLLRMEAVNSGLDPLLDQIEVTLRENIQDRRQTLETFESIRLKMDKLIG